MMKDLSNLLSAPAIPSSLTLFGLLDLVGHGLKDALLELAKYEGITLDTEDGSWDDMMKKLGHDTYFSALRALAIKKGVWKDEWD